MTEDILFDNIYVGHSVDDAKALAAATFEVKKTLETASQKKEMEEEDEEETPSFKEDPVQFIRSKILTFVDAAKIDPLAAFKTQPETGAALAVALFTIFGMIGATLGLIGPQQKPITKVCSSPRARRSDCLPALQSAKKTDAPTPDSKKTDSTPVAPAGGEKKEEGGAKKRTAAAAK